MHKLLIASLLISLFTTCQQKNSKTACDELGSETVTLPSGWLSDLQASYSEWESAPGSYSPQLGPSPVPEEATADIKREIGNMKSFVQLVVNTTKSGFVNRYQFLDDNVPAEGIQINPGFPVRFAFPYGLQSIGKWENYPIAPNRAWGGVKFLSLLWSSGETPVKKIRSVSEYLHLVEREFAVITHQLDSLALAADESEATRNLLQGINAPRDLHDAKVGIVLGHLVEAAIVTDILAQLGMKAHLDQENCQELSEENNRAYTSSEHYQQSLQKFRAGDSFLWPVGETQKITDAFVLIEKNEQPYVFWPVIRLDSDEATNALSRLVVFDQSDDFLRSWFFHLAFLRSAQN